MRLKANALKKFFPCQIWTKPFKSTVIYWDKQQILYRYRAVPAVLYKLEFLYQKFNAIFTGTVPVYSSNELKTKLTTYRRLHFTPYLLYCTVLYQYRYLYREISVAMLPATDNTECKGFRGGSTSILWSSTKVEIGRWCVILNFLLWTKLPKVGQVWKSVDFLRNFQRSLSFLLCPSKTERIRESCHVCRSTVPSNGDRVYLFAQQEIHIWRLRWILEFEFHKYFCRFSYSNTEYDFE